MQSIFNPPAATHFYTQFSFSLAEMTIIIIIISKSMIKDMKMWSRMNMFKTFVNTVTNKPS